MPEATHASTAAPAEQKSSFIKSDPGLAIWTFITFAILLVLLKKLAWGPILETLDRRESAIREALAEAEKARLAAASSIEEQQKLLAEARREAQDLLQKSRTDAERAREEMVARARSEAERLVESGRQAIEQEKRVATQEIRALAVDLALGASSKLLRTRIDEARDRELVKGYVAELEGSAPRGRA